MNENAKRMRRLLEGARRAYTEYNRLNLKIQKIRDACEHDNREFLEHYQEPGSGRNYSVYRCHDCLKSVYIRGLKGDND